MILITAFFATFVFLVKALFAAVGALLGALTFAGLVVLVLVALVSSLVCPSR